MKQIKINLIFIAIISAILFSCSSESDNDVETKITPNDIEFVGIEHNEMVGEAYDFLNQQNGNLKSAKTGIEEFLISKIRGNSKYSTESNEIAVDYVRSVFSQTSLKSLNTNDYSQYLSEKENFYLQKLDEILTDVGFNNAEVPNKILALEKEIQNESSFSDEQLIVLFSATQTARYSYSYWSENWDKWLALDGNNLKSVTGVGKDIVKGDVAGAVGGAVGALVVNVIPGLGQVAYGGAVVGGGVGASVGVAVYKLMEWW